MATKVHENISLVIPEYYVGLLMSLGKSECVSIELLPRITDLGEILSHFDKIFSKSSKHPV